MIRLSSINICKALVFIFITTKPIVDYSDPFAALAFRFLIVILLVFFYFQFLKTKNFSTKKKFYRVNL